jgi:hypothetical protein
MWQARFLRALPTIEQAYPKARWVFLTLTVRNCPITDLRSTIQSMNKAWQRLIKRKEFASNVLGWVRTTEVTKGRDGLAHPHFHCLLMVRPSYFTHNYVKHERWIELWQECARLDYRPSVRVQTVKLKPKPGSSSTESPLRRAVSETFKYSVKPADMMDRDWLVELTRQVFKLRFFASGGVLKDMLREADESDREPVEGGDGDDEPSIWPFYWWRSIKRYTSPFFATTYNAMREGGGVCISYHDEICRGGNEREPPGSGARDMKDTQQDDTPFVILSNEGGIEQNYGLAVLNGPTASSAGC